jgi:hypothetical protein
MQRLDGNLAPRQTVQWQDCGEEFCGQVRASCAIVAVVRVANARVPGIMQEGNSKKPEGETWME